MTPLWLRDNVSSCPSLAQLWLFLLSLRFEAEMLAFPHPESIALPSPSSPWVIPPTPAVSAPTFG